MSDPTREDIISEMYVALKDGTLREDDIEANAKRFAAKVSGLWESNFAPRSLDVPLFEEGGATLSDMISDPSALAAFNHIRIGVMA